MRALARIAGFALVLAAVFGAAALVGAKLDPGAGTPGHPGGSDAVQDHDASAASAAQGGGHGAAPGAVPGLAVEHGGYRLVPEATALASDAAAPYRFRIADAAGETVLRLELEHQRRLHLIVIRRDFANFQHLHPRQGDDGIWTTAVDTRDGGVYRAFADFAVAGQSLTLAADLFVPGRFDPKPLPGPVRSAAAGDGYRVALDSPAPASGGASPVRFTVSRNGRELRLIEPYLGVDGHLVALREHDQAFLHTHPEGEAGGPGPISFQVEYPSAGRYRLFLQFRHQREVRTAAFTQVVGGGDASAREGDDGRH